MLIFALGYFPLKACAALATAGAYFFSRLKPQTTVWPLAAGQWPHVALARWLTTGEAQLLERPSFLGAKERGAARLMASRVPEASVQERRRQARKKAKKKGDTPSHAHLTLRAWTRCITNVPSTLWPTETVLKVAPRRWHSELLLKSWKRYRHLASLTTTKADPTLGYLYGRLRRLVRHDALCPPLRAHLWRQPQRELSLLKLMRHGQALAARWMQAICESECAFRRFLTHLCATATRLAAKATRKRRTTAHILQESVRQHHESVMCAEAVNT